LWVCDPRLARPRLGLNSDRCSAAWCRFESVRNDFMTGKLISLMYTTAAALMLCGIVPAQAPAKFDSETISGLGARNIGSATMSGRIAAIDAVPEGQRLTIFVGSASGGVWKSLNGGATFKPVFDKQPVQSIGAITIDPKNPKVVWVGTGETWTRN